MMEKIIMIFFLSHCLVRNWLQVFFFVIASMNVHIGAMQKNIKTMSERGFVYNASDMFPCNNAITALVPPHPGHGICVIVLKGHTTFIGRKLWI